ncbi:DUF7519 family protein [Halobaculum sp. D14]|uniref:DUF7519 family protein n=1 Tax=Halobaculum sp. D14 TaxID=3421642 RepID=UPI003EBC56C2
MTRPGRTGLGVAVVAGTVAVGALLAVGEPRPALLALGGVALVAVGAHRPARRPVSLGGLTLAAGVLLAGAVGVGAVPLLVASGAAALAYDAADRAATLRAGSRRATDTREAELSGSALTLIVVLLAGGGGYLATLAVSSASATAVLALLAGAVSLVALLGSRAP